MMTQTAACLALATVVALGLSPASALPLCGDGCAVAASAHAHADLQGIHAEASVSLWATDGAGAPLVNQTLGTGPLDVAPVCSGTCTIDAATVTGYTPPLLALHSGSDVVWHATDIGHVQRDTATPLGSPAACFAVASPGGGDSPPVTFEIAGSVLNATTGATTKTCANALPVAGEAFLVPYHCTLHANMRGFLLVVP